MEDLQEGAPQAPTVQPVFAALIAETQQATATEVVEPTKPRRIYEVNLLPLPAITVPTPGALEAEHEEALVNEAPTQTEAPVSPFLQEMKITSDELACDELIDDTDTPEQYVEEEVEETFFYNEDKPKDNEPELFVSHGVYAMGISGLAPLLVSAGLVLNFVCLYMR